MAQLFVVSCIRQTPKQFSIAISKTVKGGFNPKDSMTYAYIKKVNSIG
ncbi:uncharacterized protein G2W53_034001 [Senna tora]|uniref:Uncharacterized protein n=1 Tax=Senna tora TaxID=362788 RepID=A0A834SZM6_9FABA|nr:uncharacterized protein G2W53_034001 [Senna tora]